MRRYSQQYVDLIDLEKNKFCSLPVKNVLSPDYDGIRLFTQLEQDGYLQSLHGSLKVNDIPNLIFTFEEFLKRTTFVSKMRKILSILEWNYRAPVDMEFTARLSGGQNNPQDVGDHHCAMPPTEPINRVKASPHTDQS